MKALFVTHTSDTVYGAPKSLEQILKNVDFEYDFIYPYFPKAPVPVSQMKDYIGKTCRNIYSWYLPYREDAIFQPTYKSKASIYYGLLRICEPLIKLRIKKLVKKEKYDYVFLNSSTLFPLISKQYKTVIFIREWLQGKPQIVSKLNHKLKDAFKIILIDDSIQNYLNDDITHYRVLANPVDMTGVNELDSYICAEKFGIDITDKIIVSMIGMIFEDKGSGFIIDTFQKMKRDDVILLLVGDNTGDYAKKYMAITQENPNIIWIGEQKNINQIYKISDYIIRGEKKFGIGRTVYEGLYAGCSVILQGNRQTDLKSIENHQCFYKNILFYSPRNQNDLLKVLGGLSKTDKDPAMSTAKDYIEKLMTFVKEDFT